MIPPGNRLLIDQRGTRLAVLGSLAFARMSILAVGTGGAFE